MVKNPPVNAGDMGLNPESGRCPREGNGNPPQYSYLGNPMDRGAWWAIVHGVAKESDMTWPLHKKQKYSKSSSFLQQSFPACIEEKAHRLQVWRFRTLMGQ